MAQFFYRMVYKDPLLICLLVFVQVYPWNPNGEIPVLIGFLFAFFWEGWSSNIEDFNRFQVSNTETCLSIWIVPSSKSTTSMTSMSFRVLDDLLCLIRGLVFRFLMQEKNPDDTEVLLSHAFTIARMHSYNLLQTYTSKKCEMQPTFKALAISSLLLSNHHSIHF